jgi:hypothetical protein
MATAASKPIIGTSVGLVEACEDTRLFGLKLSEKQVELLRLVEENSLVVCAAGRQSGKSLLAAAALVHNLLLRGDLDEVAGGSPRYALAIANSQTQAGITLAYARQFAERSPLLRGQLVSARESVLEFKGGRILHALPCTDRLQRGLSASAVVCDEFGHFIASTLGPRVAERVWAAIRPTIAVYGEQARTLLISTPGESDVFARMHAQAANGELGSGAVAFTATTREMNPRVSEAFLEQERVMLGPDFSREYEASFTSTASNFLDADELREVVGRYVELQPDEVTDAVLGFDPAFSVDPAAAVIVGRSRQDRKRLLVCKVMRWTPKRSRSSRRAAKTEAQRREVQDLVLDAVARLAQDYNAAVVTDQHLPAVVKAGLRDRGVDRVIVAAWTGSTLTEAFKQVRARVIANTIELPKDEQLLSELTRIRSRSRGGTSAVVVPRSSVSHMDSALALAAAVHRLETRGVPARARTYSAFKLPGRPHVSNEELEELLARPPIMGMR